MKNQVRPTSYFYDYLKKNVNLIDFIDQEAGVNLIMRSDTSASCLCPFPNHRDSKPSFSIGKTDDVWVFHCWGCGAKGTVIDFCMIYYDLPSAPSAVNYLCRKLGLKDTSEMAIQSLQGIKKKTSMRSKIESQNVTISNSCRMLLEKDYGRHKDWVFGVYKEINDALDNEDLEKIEHIGFMVYDKMAE